MPIAVVPQPNNTPPRVLLELSAVSASTATVLRTDPDGRTRPVRAAEPATLTSGAWVGFDYEAPFGVPVTYSVLLPNGTTESTNVARGKTTTLPGGYDPQKVTDGNIASDQFAGIDGTGVATTDLGATYTVDSVRVWHYYADGRTYHDTKLEVSADATTWSTVFNSAVHGSNRLAGSTYEAATVPADVIGYNNVTPGIVTPGYDSTQAVGVTTDSATNPQGIIHMAPAGTAVAAGTKVRCAAWVKATSGHVMLIQGRAFNVNDTTTLAEGGGSVSFTATGAWQYVETTEWTVTTGTFRPALQVRLNTAASGVVVQMDTTAVTARTEYAETSSGRTHTFSARPVRYVRQTANGSSANTGTHFVETQVLSPTATYTLDVHDLWLIHPGSPTLSVQVDPDRVGALNSRTRPGRSAVLHPLGRRFPIVVSDVRASTATGMTVLTETIDERNALYDLLQPGVPVLVNTPLSLSWGIAYEWAAVGDVTEDYFNRGLSTARRMTFDYTIVTRPVGAVIAEWSYTGVIGAHIDYTAVLTAYPTYADVVANSTNET